MSGATRASSPSGRAGVRDRAAPRRADARGNKVDKSSSRGPMELGSTSVTRALSRFCAGTLRATSYGPPGRHRGQDLRALEPESGQVLDPEADPLGQLGRVPGEVAAAGDPALDRLEPHLAAEHLRVLAAPVLDEMRARRPGRSTRTISRHRGVDVGDRAQRERRQDRVGRCRRPPGSVAPSSPTNSTGGWATPAIRLRASARAPSDGSTASTRSTASG